MKREKCLNLARVEGTKRSRLLQETPQRWQHIYFLVWLANDSAGTRTRSILGQAIRFLPAIVEHDVSAIDGY